MFDKPRSVPHAGEYRKEGFPVPILFIAIIAATIVLFAAFTALNPASTTNPATPATDTGINQPPTELTGAVNTTTPIPTVIATETPKPTAIQEREINLPIVHVMAPRNYLQDPKDLSVKVFYTGGNPLIRGELIINDPSFVEFADSNIPVVSITLFAKDDSYGESYGAGGANGVYPFTLGKNLQASAEELEENYALAIEIY